jgi:hypothetical protein
MRSLAAFNRGKSYAEQIKPFNFLLSAQVHELGYPLGVDPQRFHLIAPFETDPAKWLTQPWIDLYSGERFRATTSHDRGRNVARLKTYTEVLTAHEYHPELKCDGPNGQPCGKRTVGLLRLRDVVIESVAFIGKESNRLEEVEEHMLSGAEQVYTEYPDPARDKWTMKILPVLWMMPMTELQTQSRLSRAARQALRAGRKPHPRDRRALIDLTVHYVGRIQADGE